MQSPKDPAAPSLLDRGPTELHDFVASRLEPALGRALPLMEIRFEDLSLKADVPVVENSSGLPTLWNAVRLAFARIGHKPRVVRREILKDVTGSFRPVVPTEESSRTTG